MLWKRGSAHTLLTLEYSSSTRDQLQWAAESQEREKQWEEGETSRSWVSAREVCMGLHLRAEESLYSRQKEQPGLEGTATLRTLSELHGFSSSSVAVLFIPLSACTLSFPSLSSRSPGFIREGQLTERPSSSFRDTDQMFN